MQSFKQYIKENAGPKKIHEILNKSQMKSLRKHPSFQNYVYSPTTSIYAKEDEHDSGPGSSRNVILTNSDNKHKMHVAITNRGKVLGHSIYRKNKMEDGKIEWQHVKTVDGA